MCLGFPHYFDSVLAVSMCLDMYLFLLDFQFIEIHVFKMVDKDLLISVLTHVICPFLFLTLSSLLSPFLISFG